MVNIFEIIFYQPILNLLIWLYNIVPGHDVGWAIIGLTVIVKLILYPLSQKSLHGQQALQNLQPKLDEIKKKYPDNKEEQSRAMMELYKQEGVNPLSSCLPLIIQLPFFWAIFRVFRNELAGKAVTLLYPFIHNPGTLNTLAFGLIDFSKPNAILAILAGVAQFLQAKMMPTKAPAATQGNQQENMMAAMNKQMLYFMPAITIFISWSLPSGLAFYWFISTILTIVQQWIMFRKLKKPTVPIQGEIVK